MREQNPGNPDKAAIQSKPTVQDKRSTFRKLHESGCFVIPNPWDVGSAVALEDMGYKAIASSSIGFAWSLGLADNHVPRDRVVEHLRELVQAVNIPVNADFEGGYADTAAGVAESVRMAVDAGVAGLSIEDASGDPANPLYDLDVALERLKAARKAIDQSGQDVLLVGRSEGFIRGRPDLDETLARLKAYANAGADVLFAPGAGSAEQVRAIVQAAAGKPVNVVVGSPGALSVDELAALGVRRISLGGSLARAAWAGFLGVARDIAASANFKSLEGATPAAELQALFKGRK